MMKRLGLRKPIGMAVIILVLLLSFEIDLSVAGAGENADTTAIAKKKSKAQTRDDKRKKKKEKKKSDDDDDDSDGAQVKAARPTPPFSIPPLVAGKRYAYFIAMGDWGTGSPAQRHVAGLMDAKAGRDSLKKGKLNLRIRPTNRRRNRAAMQRIDNFNKTDKKTNG